MSKLFTNTIFTLNGGDVYVFKGADLKRISEGGLLIQSVANEKIAAVGIEYLHEHHATPVLEHINPETGKKISEDGENILRTDDISVYVSSQDGIMGKMISGRYVDYIKFDDGAVEDNYYVFNDNVVIRVNREVSLY